MPSLVTRGGMGLLALRPAKFRKAYRYYKLNVTASALQTQIFLRFYVGATAFPPGNSTTGNYPMTSNSAPSPYVSSASSVSGSSAAWTAFNWNGTPPSGYPPSLGWAWSSLPAWLKLDLGASNKQAFTSFHLAITNNGGDLLENVAVGPTAFTVQGSNDDSTYDVLKTVTGLSWDEGHTSPCPHCCCVPVEAWGGEKVFSIP